MWEIRSPEWGWKTNQDFSVVHSDNLLSTNILEGTVHIFRLLNVALIEREMVFSLSGWKTLLIASPCWRKCQRHWFKTWDFEHKSHRLSFRKLYLCVARFVVTLQRTFMRTFWVSLICILDILDLKHRKSERVFKLPHCGFFYTMASWLLSPPFSYLIIYIEQFILLVHTNII